MLSAAKDNKTVGFINDVFYVVMTYLPIQKHPDSFENRDADNSV